MRRDRALAAATPWLAACLSGCVGIAAAQPPVLEVSKDYNGAPQSIAFDGRGPAWLATRGALYALRGGMPIEPTTVPSNDWITVAPAGGIYAWLHGVRSGLYTVELYTTGKDRIAQLDLDGQPAEVGGIYLGGNGDLVMTVTPLDDAEGLRGRFLFAFWTSRGVHLRSVTLDGPRTVVVSAAGDAVLLLGRRDASAFRSDGNPLWTHSGAFRHAAIAAGGDVALLNPAPPNTAQVQIHRGRGGATSVTTIGRQSPVFEVDLAADGSLGAIATRNELFVFDPNCPAQSCDEPPQVPLSLAGTFRITDIAFATERGEVLAVGAIERVGDRAPYTYPRGWVVLVDTAPPRRQRGQPVEVALEQPATWAPLLDTSPDDRVRTVAARTPHRVLLIDF